MDADWQEHEALIQTWLIGDIMPPPKLSDRKIDEHHKWLYQQALTHMAREANWVHNRQTWGMTLNAAWFALLFSLSKTIYDNNVKFFCTILLCILGISTTLIARNLINAANEQVDYIVNDLAERLGIKKFVDSASRHGVVEYNWLESDFQRPSANMKKHKFAHKWAMRIPFLFVAVWCFIAFGASIVYEPDFFKPLVSEQIWQWISHLAQKPSSTI